MQPAPPGEHPDLLLSYLAVADAPCPECGYSLRGVAATACPECGQPLRLGLQRDLTSPRTAPLAAVALGLVLLAHALFLGTLFVPIWQSFIAGMPAPSAVVLWTFAFSVLVCSIAAAVVARAAIARHRNRRAESRKILIDGAIIVVVIQASISLLWRLIDYL